MKFVAFDDYTNAPVILKVFDSQEAALKELEDYQALTTTVRMLEDDEAYKAVMDEILIHEAHAFSEWLISTASRIQLACALQNAESTQHLTRDFIARIKEQFSLIDDPSFDLDKHLEKFTDDHTGG